MKYYLYIIAFLCFTTLSQVQSSADTAYYGNNPAAGHYLDVGDAKLYYEIYGSGQPIVLLHGGVYGYIDEFEPFINKLKDTYRVICIATRGHGKSAIGHQPFTYRQRAEDAFKVIRSITKDSVTVLGFSDGGYSAAKLASLHPELVKKLIIIGAGDRPAGNNRKKFNYNEKELMQQAPQLFKNRLALMPEPKRWPECLSMLNDLYNDSIISTETYSKIKCPVLVMGGDRDEYIKVQALATAATSIANAQLSVIPGCGHVVFYCNFPAVWASLEPFLKK
ncbi:hypothetical protein A8C56_11125 [Niabella ginsenosidivorans]|uniref:AB hydrolase-1 domain-containing protein n=1 Tax=Niabella ginsenosidivorans TaxID=1176587 RepID=A0A1A9I1C9_9BACT|nr:alpha/beta hydrolase [Niabella ginsenosidivorans]ANH81458.1 hypothetical protein A8C56_11125 [Niabella ginsenosidivorans]